MTRRSNTYLALIGLTSIVGTTTLLAQARVEVVKVAARPVERQTKLPGEFQPYLAVPIFAKVNGFVKAVNVDRGSAVKPGQVLATLEAPEMMSQVAERQQRRRPMGQRWSWRTCRQSRRSIRTAAGRRHDCSPRNRRDS